MHWHNESWVKLYIRRTAEWDDMSVMARGMGDELLKYAKNDGSLCRTKGREPAMAVALVLKPKADELEAVVAGAAELLDDGYLVVAEGFVWIKNFEDAQERRTYNAVKQQRYRDKQVQPIRERDGWACRYCGAKDDLTTDRVIPRTQGGSDDEENLVTACGRCNFSKGPRTPEEAGMKLLPPPKQRKRLPGDGNSMGNTKTIELPGSETIRSETTRDSTDIPSGVSCDTPKTEPPQLALVTQGPVKPRKRADSPNESYQLVAAFDESWVKRFEPADGKAPPHSQSDWRIAKLLVAAHTLPVAVKYALRFVADDDQFVAKRGHQFADIPSRIPAYKKASQGPPTGAAASKRNFREAAPHTDETKDETDAL